MYDSSINLLLPSGFVQAILEQLQKYFEDFIRGAGTPSKTIHYNNLKRFKLRWKRVRSDDLCFACLRRTPENNWPCGHAVCENCVRVFGQEDENDRWAFGVQRCFLCDMALREVTVKLKPDTAGVNVLTIDGGGIKGVVPLLFLQTLQDRLGLPIPVQDHFEIAFGTSSGRWTPSVTRAVADANQAALSSSHCSSVDGRWTIVRIFSNLWRRGHSDRAGFLTYPSCLAFRSCRISSNFLCRTWPTVCTQLIIWKVH